MDIRPNDHDHPALSHDLPDHTGNMDDRWPSARPRALRMRLVSPAQKVEGVRDLLDRATWDYSQDGEAFARFLSDLRDIVDS